MGRVPSAGWIAEFADIYKSWPQLRVTLSAWTRKIFRHLQFPPPFHVTLRIAPMLGFKRFKTAAITIAGIELLRRIHKGQFNLGGLHLKYRSTSAIWNTVLAAQ